MPLIALTGGIAAGKSTIARRLAEHGAVVVDADALVREVQQSGSPVLARIAEEFGTDVIRADGTLDRAALGAVVFGDDAQIARLHAPIGLYIGSKTPAEIAISILAELTAVKNGVPQQLQVQHAAAAP